MPSQTLYDKIIEVTLYKREPVPVIRVTPSADKWQSDTQKVGHSLKNVHHTGSLYIYEGYSHKQYVYTDKAQGVKTYTAHGPLFRFTDEESIYLGVRPDGTEFQTGDKIYISSTHKKYHVINNSTYVPGSASDTYTETAYSGEGQQKITISCPDFGMKPDITMSVNLIPGQSCYKMVVKIRNLNIDSINIRDWTHMTVKAGYKSDGGQYINYTCPVFSSYVESPNPDGITVFEGLTVGGTEGVLTEGTIRINFLSGKTTLREIISKCADHIAPGIEVASTLTDEMMDAPVSTNINRTIYAQNGLAILNWLQTTISKILYESFGGCSSFVQLVDGKLYIQVVNGPSASPVLTDSIVNLNMIKSAVFNGTALTVEAPWNPSLSPGDLFYMPPEFLNGSKLPNSIPSKDYTNEQNLYRVLTMSVQFATAQDTNNMTILSVPAQYADALPNSTSLDLTGDDVDRLFMSLDTKALGSNDDAINIGHAEENTSTEAVTKASSPETGNALFDNSQGILATFNGATVSIDPNVMGNCISQIARWYCEDYENGPKLQEGKGHKSNYRSFYYTRDELKNNDKALNHFQNNGIRDYAIWWPLIVTATYWTKYKEDQAGRDNTYTPIELDNPDFILAGRSLVIPVWPGSWEAAAWKSVVNVYKDAYTTYGQKYPNLSLWWRAMYYYLGGTGDLG